MQSYIIKRNFKVKNKNKNKNTHNPTTLSKLFHFVSFSSVCISVCNFYKVVSYCAYSSEFLFLI